MSGQGSANSAVARQELPSCAEFAGHSCRPVRACRRKIRMKSIGRQSAPSPVRLARALLTISLSKTLLAAKMAAGTPKTG
jgi:hypothetical protein